MTLKRFYRAMALLIRSRDEKQKNHYLDIMVRIDARLNELDRAAANIRPFWG